MNNPMIISPTFYLSVEEIEINEKIILQIIQRKVILPEGATFNRLNDIIQNITNFQSGYPNYPYHLFEFHLGNLIVTNNEEAYLEYHHYKNNKKCIKKD